MYLPDRKRFSVLVFLAGLLCIALIGCGGSGTDRVKPSISTLPVQDGQAMGSAKYPFPPSVGSGRFEVYYQGYGVRKVSGSWPQPSIRIQFSCENDSDVPLLFDTTETTLVDSRGDVIRCGGAMRDGAPAESFEEVRPHSHAQFDIFFDLRKGYRLEKVDNFKVYWRYKAGDETRSEETMFVRCDPGRMLYRDGDGRLRRYEYFMAVSAGRNRREATR